MFTTLDVVLYFMLGTATGLIYCLFVLAATFSRPSEQKVKQGDHPSKGQPV